MANPQLGSVSPCFQFLFNEVPAFRHGLLYYSYPGAIKGLLETFPQLRLLTPLELRDHFGMHQYLLVGSTLVENLLATGHQVFLLIHPELEVVPFILNTQPPSSSDCFQTWTPSLDRGLLLLVLRHGSPTPLSDAQICSLPHRRTEPASIPGAPTCWRSVEISLGTWTTRLSYLAELPQTPVRNLVLMPDSIVSLCARIQLHSGTEEPLDEFTASFMTSVLETHAKNLTRPHDWEAITQLVAIHRDPLSVHTRRIQFSVEGSAWDLRWLLDNDGP